MRQVYIPGPRPRQLQRLDGGVQLCGELMGEVIVLVEIHQVVAVIAVVWDISTYLDLGPASLRVLIGASSSLVS